MADNHRFFSDMKVSWNDERILVSTYEDGQFVFFDLNVIDGKLVLTGAYDK